MKFNLLIVREDIRRLGLIITSAGLLNTLFETGNLLATTVMLSAGILALALGNLEHKS